MMAKMKQVVNKIFNNLGIHTLKGHVIKIHNAEGSLHSVFPLEIFITTFMGMIIMMIVHFD
jgi:hypothetical protein